MHQCLLNALMLGRASYNLGAVWRVGNGQNISIWDHNWLPEPGMSRVVSPKINEGLNRVCDLFYPNTKIWNWEVLQNSFYPWEAKVTRNIYVSEMCNMDFLVWPKTADGCYSVKFAYQMLATEVINKAPSSSNEEGLKVWRSIWNIKAPPKVRHFM